MKAFRISRAPAVAGQAMDTYAKLVFEPALESDELFDALRESYPTLRTHTERKKQAVLDFLMDERQAIEHEITAFVQQTGTPAPQPDASYSSRPSPVYSTSSSLNLRKLSTSNSSSSSTRSAGSSPETLSLKDMTSVWTAAGHGKPKIHTRRSMTTKEKEEYRRRRQMKACKECRSRKRKCNHDHSNASSAASPRTDAKVKKRTSTAASSHPPPQQSFLSNEFDGNSLLADSTFSTSDSPLDFLDFSPATGTEGSFDDFLLLPQDDFSPIDFATDPLFQPVPQSFSYDPFIEPQLSEQHYAPSTGSRSPASTYQSSGMSRSGSSANALDTSQSWSFDLDPMVDMSGGHALHTIFSSGSTDGKQSGLAAGLRSSRSSPASHRPSTAQSSLPTLPSASGQPSHSRDGADQSRNGLMSPSLGTMSNTLHLLEGTLRPAPSSSRIRRETWQEATHGATATHTLNAHTSMDLSGDINDILHAVPDRTNDGRNDNDARRDGLVLGTDPSAGSRFGEHGRSIARRQSTSGRVDTVQHQVLSHPGGEGLFAASPSVWESQRRDTGAPLSSRNPSSVNDPSSAHSDAHYVHFTSPVASGSRHRINAPSQSTTSVIRSRTVVRDEIGISAPASATAGTGFRDVSNSSADRALATSRACKGEEPKRANVVGKTRLPELPNGANDETSSSLAVVHTRPTAPRETDGPSLDIQQHSSLWLESSVSVVVFAIASIASLFVRTVVSSLLFLASTIHAQNAPGHDYHRRRAKDISFAGVSSSLTDIITCALVGIGKVRQGKGRVSTASTTSSVCSSLLNGVSRSCVFV